MNCHEALHPAEIWRTTIQAKDWWSSTAAFYYHDETWATNQSSHCGWKSVWFPHSIEIVYTIHCNAFPFFFKIPMAKAKPWCINASLESFKFCKSKGKVPRESRSILKIWRFLQIDSTIFEGQNQISAVWQPWTKPSSSKCTSQGETTFSAENSVNVLWEVIPPAMDISKPALLKLKSQQYHRQHIHDWHSKAPAEIELKGLDRLDIDWR